jgi:hypothetical protein
MIRPSYAAAKLHLTSCVLLGFDGEPFRFCVIYIPFSALLCCIVVCNPLCRLMREIVANAIIDNPPMQDDAL